MANKNRNRQQQQDWNDNYSRHRRNYEYEEPNYTDSENRGYRNSGHQTGTYPSEGGWQSRYERQMQTGREGDFDNDYQSRFNRQNENRGSGLTSGYSDFGTRGRNLYDRGHQGMGRRDFENRENRLGGANYDRYGDHGRYNQGSDSFGYGHTSFEGGSPRSNRDFESPGYGRSNWDYQRSRDYGRGDQSERSWWDRTGDEISSWFGDEDAERRRSRDRQMQQSFRGKGPKSYKRSDERITDDVNDRLSDDPFVDASDITVTANDGEITLTGTVDHRNAKRRAEDIAEDVSGVKNVENRLRVSQLASGYTSPMPGANSPSGTSASSTASSSSDRSRKGTSE